ncbi:acyl-CoA dehydratase activase [Alkalispirochaeta americana]|nr:acyl-CoA dehydratase activase [Alkalispirochaeta americana]
MKNHSIEWWRVIPHEGAVISVLERELALQKLPRGTRVLVTGTEARELVQAASAIEPLCLERALAKREQGAEPAVAIVSMGGEELILYTLDEQGHVRGNFSGNKCASGTGEFFRQQLGRMHMELDEVNLIPEDTATCALSSRCSVFMKSDCTHKLNKRQASREEITVSLSQVMATKVADFLSRAKISSGRVILTGGITANRHVLRALRGLAPEITFDVPPEAVFYEAFGAALLAEEAGTIPDDTSQMVQEARIRFERFPSLRTAQNRVTYFEEIREPLQAGGRYILGIDGGSTTTKVCLVNTETGRIAASHYGRTHGDPVRALKVCLSELQKQIQDQLGDGATLVVELAATTGSSRETLGLFVETPGVYNEIIAHACGTTQFSDQVDTIFEIGGQDAKYVLLQNRVPIDYAMNEACSAGTGSFLEESAAGDLNIPYAHQIGDLALQAAAPLKFGEHCSAFINSDIRKAIAQGASREDITAGIVTSVVANYLNRVVGNRTIGKTVFLQGGVAKNEAVAPAFAMLLNRDILVPPDPELMGCYGVAILAREKNRQGLLEKGNWALERILATEIFEKGEFVCSSCDNLCPIRILEVNGHRRFFGGRCSKYSNSGARASSVGASGTTTAPGEAVNYVDERNRLLFQEYAAPAAPAESPSATLTVGIPRSFSVHSLYPFYSWFFHTLGFRTVLSDGVDRKGVARVESSYCFPAEIAHGAVQNVIDKGVDFIFTPHVRDLESYEDSVHANFCPITQGLPYYIRKAFPDIPPERFLDVVVSFKHGPGKARDFFRKLALPLGVSEARIDAAFALALEKQQAYREAAQALGQQALAEARENQRSVIALLGRPYNAFTSEANMGIPRKFTSRGHVVIPFDILPLEEGQEIFPNMYWYYGQQDMKASALLKDEPNIYVTFISNFSCAPDSFLLHYLKWQMGTKPFLILELDSHSADAGIDTRIEAFLDIVEGYASRRDSLAEERYDNGLRLVVPENGDIVVHNSNTGEDIPVRDNPSVQLLLSNMGELGTELLAAVIRSRGINAQALPPADSHTVMIARGHCSGKECVPAHLVLGNVLQFLASDQYRKDEIYLVFVPITTGPCRTGQYYVFYENLFRDLRIDNLVIFTMSADNSYTEIGPDVGAAMWQSLVISDYMKDIETALRTCAEDPGEAITLYRQEWQKLVQRAEGNFSDIYPALKEAAQVFQAIPLARDLSQVPKALVVGEIYVRRDDYAVDELVGTLARQGIMAKVSGVSEWIHYLDFVRDYELRKRLSLRPLWVRPFAQEARALLRLGLERAWKHRIEQRVLKILATARLVPPGPGTMKKIMERTKTHFVNPELNSEIAVSTGAAAAAMENGYSGIVNISPFACLIGRVIEGVFAPWARTRNYPLLSVEVDGNQLPPTTLNRLNVFAVNVSRYNGHDNGEGFPHGTGLPLEGVSPSGRGSDPCVEAAGSCTGGPLRPGQVLPRES